MSDERPSVQQFLLVYDRKRNKLVDQREFGTDAAGAADAYREAERKFRDHPEMDIVLIGSDSIETVKKTHSTYFGGVSSKDIDELVSSLEESLEKLLTEQARQ